MARSRPVDNQRSRSKSALIEELTASIAKFQEILRTIEDCSQDGFPYRDAAQAKAELQLKERVRQTFGERSQEFQRCRTIKLRTSNRADAEQSMAMIKGLIRTLEERKLELQGLKPPPPPTPPPDTTTSNTARLVLVTPATSATTEPTHSTTPITMAVAMTTNISPPPIPVAPTVHQPATHGELKNPTLKPEPPASDPRSSSALPSGPDSPASTTLSAPIEPIPVVSPLPRKHSTVNQQADQSAHIDPIPAVSTPPLQHPAVGRHPAQSSSIDPIPATPSLSHESPTTVQPPGQPNPPIAIVSTPSSPQPFTTPVARIVPSSTLSCEQPTVVKPSLESTPSALPSSQVVPPQPAISATPIVPRHSSASLELPSAQSSPQDQLFDHLWTNPINTRATPQSTADHDPLSLIRKICLRFHSVVRQLRLRKDYRPTLEVEDDYDLQDLFCALLRVEFDEVATEEWIPPYADGAPRTTFFVNKDQIAILTRKTRPGLTTKELADQVTADAAYYREQGRCSTLLCFMYDPEGRVGSPKLLETTLTSVHEHYRVEVLVAPK